MSYPDSFCLPLPVWDSAYTEQGRTMQKNKVLALPQVLRGFGAMGVLLFHSALLAQHYFGDWAPLKVFGAGWSGVQLFFVLSGFIIYHAHQRDIGETGRTGRYLLRRVTRIYPLYAVVFLALLPFWLTVFGGHDRKEPGALISSFLLIPQDHLPHLQVAWTLSHELLFYLLFALLIVSRNAWGVLIAWFGLSAVTATLFPTMPFPLSFVFSANNALFGLGVLAAVLGERVPWRDSRTTLWVCAGSFVLLAVAIPEPSSTPLVFAFGGLSFLLLLQATSPRLNEIAARQPTLQLLGDASYSIYLTHLPAIALVCKGASLLMPESNTLLVFGFAVAVSVTCGLLCYRWVEQPLARTMRTVFG